MITEAKLKQFRNELKEFSKAMEDKFGIAVDVGSISYSSDQASGRLKITSTEEHGDAQEAKDIADFKRAMYKHGLDLSDRLKVFEYGNKSYRLMSLRPRAPKWPFIVEEVGGGNGKRVILKKYPGVIATIKGGRK